MLCVYIFFWNWFTPLNPIISIYVYRIFRPGLAAGSFSGKSEKSGNLEIEKSRNPLACSASKSIISRALKSTQVALALCVCACLDPSCIHGHTRISQIHPGYLFYDFVSTAASAVFSTTLFWLRSMDFVLISLSVGSSIPIPDPHYPFLIPHSSLPL